MGSEKHEHSKRVDEIARLRKEIERESEIVKELVEQLGEANSKARRYKELLKGACDLLFAMGVQLDNVHRVVGREVKTQLVCGGLDQSRPVMTTLQWMNYLANGIAADKETIKEAGDLIDKIKKEVP
jgi:hypothetical protein